MPPQTQIRQDEESLLFAQRALTKIANKIYERTYPFKMANGEIIPVDIMSKYAAESFIEIAEFDVFGLAAIIADYSKGGPRVGVVARRQVYPIKTVGDHCAWSWEEILKAQAHGLPLQEKNLAATRTAYEAYLNKLGYYGDQDYGLPGLLNSNLPRMSAATTFAGAASPDALLALLNSPITAMLTSTNSMEMPARIVLPQRQFQQLGTTMRASNSDISVLAAFLNLQREMGQPIEIIVDDNLKEAGTNKEDVMLILPYDRDAICLGVARDFQLLPVQQINLEYVVHGLGRVIGAMVIRPMSGLIIEGI